MDVQIALSFIYILTVAGSDKVEVKHQNVQTESVEIKDQHVQTKAIQIAATETTDVKLITLTFSEGQWFWIL